MTINPDVTDEIEIACQLIAMREAFRNGSHREVREALGMSVPDIANLIKVSANTVRRWEARSSAPRGDAAYRYAPLFAAMRNQLAEGKPS